MYTSKGTLFLRSERQDRMEMNFSSEFLVLRLSQENGNINLRVLYKTRNSQNSYSFVRGSVKVPRMSRFISRNISKLVSSESFYGRKEYVRYEYTIRT